MPDIRLPLLLRSRWWVLLLLALLLAGATQRTALAHALLARSEPAANAELSSPPASVEMWFSEPLESRFSHARLVDGSGQDVTTAGPSLVDAADPTHMSLTLAKLTPGIYTVVWTTLSSVDGHEWVGSFPLTLLNPDGSRPAAGVGYMVEGETDEVPSPLKSAARWLSLLGAILLVGGLIFREAIARPVLVDQPASDLAYRLSRSWRLLGTVAVAGIVLGGFLQLGAQLAALGGSASLIDLLFATQPGRLLLLRQLLLLPVVALLVTSQRSVTGVLPRNPLDHLRAASEWLIGLLLLATFSLASHAGAVPGRGWAVIGDLFHLVAAAGWMGGLILLAALVWSPQSGPGVDPISPAGQAVLGRILRRFSLFAAAAVFVLTITGLFSSVVQLPSLASLWETTYGLLLLGKLALVAAALGLAFLNNRAVQRSTAEADGVESLGSPPTSPPSISSSSRLARRIRLEALVSLGLLLVVALLVQTPPPPRPQAYVAPALPFTDIALADDLLIHLQITPNQPGSNRFWTHLYHPDGSPIGDVQLVRLFFVPESAELGQARTDLPPDRDETGHEIGNDIFVDQGAWLGQPGDWDVTVYVRRRGLDDATGEFRVSVPPPAGLAALGTVWENPAASLPLPTVAGGLLVALGLAPFLWWKPVRRRNRDAAPMLGGVGIACLIVGLVFGVQGMASSTDASNAEASIAVPTVDSVATPVVAGVSVLSTPLSPLSPLATADPNDGTPEGTPGPTPTPDALFLAGEVIFQTNCVQCHGPSGMGDGPAAAALPVQPAVLPFHVPQHSNEEVYLFVSQGLPNLGMPAFREILTTDEINQVVRYLRVRFGNPLP